MERNLSLSIRLHEGGFSVTVSEPESGETKEMAFQPGDPAFSEEIGNEILSWITLWADEMEEEKGDRAA